MSLATTAPHAPAVAPSLPWLNGISERTEAGLVILSPSSGRTTRRVLFINSYGGEDVWQKIKRGLYPPHHLWGCLELARMGYEVALAEPLPHFSLLRRPFPHDLRFLRFVRAWLRPDDIIYCGHTLLYWLPLLKALGAIKCAIVSLTYARENLEFSRLHAGIIALTPAAAQQARLMAPRVEVAHLAWGCDLDFFPVREYRPEWFLSCGITRRDFSTLSAAAAHCQSPLRLIAPGPTPGLHWPPNVTVVDGGEGWSFQKAVISYAELINNDYARAAASLIILQPDPQETTAVGFTNTLEAMAMARPVIVTRTGAIPGELDVESAGVGLHVPPADPHAIAAAVQALASDPDRAREMGLRGRALAESHYNINRYARQLHAFFNTL